MTEKQIRKLMIDLELSQVELADITGVPRNRINDAIAGRREGKKYFPIIVDTLKQIKANGRREAA